MDVAVVEDRQGVVLAASPADEGDNLRRGPWTVDEDVLLVNYIAAHGEGRWNSLARAAGLRRTGKSCRLRWLNYLRPDVRRGDITPAEQLLILDLHSLWGNRWSKIAQHLPGRTDNEVKNYWRTRVQKHARQLRCDVNSAQFRDVVRRVWMPRLLERIHADESSRAAPAPAPATTLSAPAACQYYYQAAVIATPPGNGTTDVREPSQNTVAAAASPEYSSCISAHWSSSPSTGYSTSSSAPGASATTIPADGAPDAGVVAQRAGDASSWPAMDGDEVFGGSWSELLATTGDDAGGSSMSMIGLPDFGFGDFEEDLWSLEDICSSQHQY